MNVIIGKTIRSPNNVPFLVVTGYEEGDEGRRGDGKWRRQGEKGKKFSVLRFQCSAGSGEVGGDG